MQSESSCLLGIPLYPPNCFHVLSGVSAPGLFSFSLTVGGRSLLTGSHVWHKRSWGGGHLPLWRTVCVCPALAGGLVALSLRRRTHQPVKGCGWAGHTQVMPHGWRWGGRCSRSPQGGAAAGFSARRRRVDLSWFVVASSSHPLTLTTQL